MLQISLYIYIFYKSHQPWPATMSHLTFMKEQKIFSPETVYIYQAVMKTYPCWNSIITGRSETLLTHTCVWTSSLLREGCILHCMHSAQNQRWCVSYVDSKNHIDVAIVGQVRSINKCWLTISNKSINNNHIVVYKDIAIKKKI